MTKVKICGITRLEDALAAAEYGADALGFVFYKASPRYIDPKDAARIVKKLPPFVTPVALFVNEKEETVMAVLRTTGIAVIQFHGDETPAYVSSYGQRVIKAIRVVSEASLNAVHDYDVNAFLMDAYSPDLFGGTGAVFNWDLLKERNLSERVILAGGLTPDNVAAAVAGVIPYGVDVSSGVEISPGIKDHLRMRAFIENAKKKNSDD